MGKKVSIIVPVYNSKKYLKKCIDSILSQSYKEFELLLINDGSTDCSRDICKSYDDKRIKYLEQKNEGVSSARNKGIKECNGDFITFVDSDDRLLPDYLKTLTDLQRKYDTDITMCTFKSINERGRSEEIYSPEWEKDIWLKGLDAKKSLTEKVLANTGNKRPVMAPYCKLYRADIIKNNTLYFDEKLPIGEDLLFNLKYAQHIESFVFKREILYKRLIREGSAVTSCRPYIYKELKRLFDGYYSIKEKYDIRPVTEKGFFFNKINDSFGLYVFRSNNIKELNYRVKCLYRFLSSKSIGPIWNSISLKDLPNRKDKLKYIIIKNHLVCMWSLIKIMKK